MENFLDSDLLFVGLGVVVAFLGLGAIIYGIVSWLNRERRSRTGSNSLSTLSQLCQKMDQSAQ